MSDCFKILVVFCPLVAFSINDSSKNGRGGQDNFELEKFFLTGIAIVVTMAIEISNITLVPGIGALVHYRFCKVGLSHSNAVISIIIS